MAQAKIKLQRLVQDSQEYGSNDEHMVSRVFFDLEIDDTKYQGLHCDVKQMVGSSFETAPLEVSAPTGYNGPFNHQAFQQIVERYYRGLLVHRAEVSGSPGVPTSACRTTHSFSPARQRLKYRFLVAHGETPNPALKRTRACGARRLAPR